MKSLLLGLIYFFLFSINLQEVRQLYPKAKDDAFIVDSLYSQLSSVGIEDNLVLYGYKGAIATLKAKYAKGIKDKKTFFKEGAEMMEDAIAADPENVELHFIRLTVQENAPRIVNYQDQIESDKAIILKNYSLLKEREVKEMIQSYCKSSKAFTEEEKATF